MKRRSFLKVSLAGSLALGLSGYTRQDKTHIITLSFDDGFKKSFYKIADIHEAYGLMACLNVIATGHYSGFRQPITAWMLVIWPRKCRYLVGEGGKRIPFFPGRMAYFEPPWS